MWQDLHQSDKERYQTLITNFASLSEAFSQKAEGNSDESTQEYVAPIVNSKFQETVFQKAFNAVVEDIANTSYDASLVLDEKHKYLVGIKSFGVNSGDQKIAQFKKDSQNWSEILSEIKLYFEISPDKKTADEENKERYTKLAKEIARLRNQRIESSKAQIKGFKSNDVEVDSVYHVLMPTSKGEFPQIFVGETPYLPIDVNNLEILGSTSDKKPLNFRFTDGFHVYKYTSSDSQLYMTFNNGDIIVDSWDISYVEDPFYLFEHLHEISQASIEDDIEKTVSWMIPDKNYLVNVSSGFNAFNGGSKLSRKNSVREKRINKFKERFYEILPKQVLDKIIKYLNLLLIPEYRSDKEHQFMRKKRLELLELVDSTHNLELKDEVENLVSRGMKEVYIPIPDSYEFHNEFPNFFGENIGTFKDNSKKLALAKENRVFTLRFLPSGDEIKAYINQEAGKSIQSYKKQSVLGEWLLKEVFQLQDREILTNDKLVELQINAIRLIKYKNDSAIGIEFIWIDEDNPPKDAIGWVSKNK
ncbi:hypothetical protein LGW97_09545 [Streptococcus mutans]|nr:hypothetical protein [Streptococcus mutans]